MKSEQNTTSIRDVVMTGFKLQTISGAKANISSMASNLLSHQIPSKSAFVRFGSFFLPKNAISLNFGSSFSLSKAMMKSKLRASSGEDLTKPPSLEDVTKPPSGENLTNPLGEELEQKKADEEKKLFKAFVDKCIENLYLPPHYREVKHTQWMYFSGEAFAALPEVGEFMVEDNLGSYYLF